MICEQKVCELGKIQSPWGFFLCLTHSLFDINEQGVVFVVFAPVQRGNNKVKKNCTVHNLMTVILLQCSAGMLRSTNLEKNVVVG